jgi:hypothetical protein
VKQPLTIVNQTLRLPIMLDRCPKQVIRGPWEAIIAARPDLFRMFGPAIRWSRMEDRTRFAQVSKLLDRHRLELLGLPGVTGVGMVQESSRTHRANWWFRSLFVPK